MTRTVAWTLYQRARLRLGAAILGRGWLGTMQANIIIANRARACITPEGQVILANCQPLADALYKPIPGRWALSVALIEEVGDDSQG